MLRGSLLAAALLPLLGLGSGPGHVRNGRIAYSHLGAGSNRSQIYTTTAQGTHRRHLIAGTFSNLAPAYSPNGKRIVFVRASKQSDLWTMNADGSHPKRLTSTKSIDEIDPAWAPDGKRIAFSVETPAADEGVWTVDADGRNRTRLTTADDLNVSWSPDGSEIAFQRHTFSPPTGPVDQLFAVPAAGGAPVDLTNDLTISDLQPAWSPAGNRILFSSVPNDGFELDLWTMSPAGGDRTRVTNTPNLDEHDPSWSPDGKRIVYVAESSSSGAASYQLYVSNANGLKRRVVTHACGSCAIINEDPSWQPLR
jgi:Tol biopolymer transport system component